MQNSLGISVILENKSDVTKHLLEKTAGLRNEIGMYQENQS